MRDITWKDWKGQQNIFNLKIQLQTLIFIQFKKYCTLICFPFENSTNIKLLITHISLSQISFSYFLNKHLIIYWLGFKDSENNWY